MKLFKLNIKIDYNDSIIDSLTGLEKNNIYNKVISEINHNYNIQWKENNYKSLKIFVNCIFIENHIINTRFFDYGTMDGNYIGQLSGRSIYLLNNLKDDEYFIGNSEKEYEIYLRNKKLKKIKETI